MRRHGRPDHAARQDWPRRGEVWLVDLTTSRIEVYREPTAEGYRDVQILVRGQSVTPIAFADLTVAVGDLVG